MKNKTKNILFISLFIIGLLFIFFSFSLGNFFTFRYINNVGGSIDLSILSTLLSIYSHSFQLIGALISVTSVILFVTQKNRKDGFK